MGELKAMVKGKRTEGEIPRKARLVHHPGLEELFGDGKGGEDRDERIYEAVEYGYRLREVRGEPERGPGMSKVKT